MNNQLKKLSEIVPPRAFVIPDYQRGYAWEKRHRQDLLDDLRDLDALPDTTKVHYTGTIVLHRGRPALRTVAGRSLEVFEVIDGQQRLTTLVILLSVLARRLASLGVPAAPAVLADYVACGDVQKLTPNGDAARFFRDHVVGTAPNAAPSTPPERAMLEAREQFEGFVAGLLASLDGDAARVERLERWRRLVTERLGFVVFEVDDEADVGVMFESMNARGKRLTQFELVKNYLLFVAAKLTSGESLREVTRDVNETWRKVVTTLDTADPSEEVDTALRYHWAIWPAARGLDGEPVWKTGDVHRAMKSVIRPRGGADAVLAELRAYLRDLESATRAYADLRRPGRSGAFGFARGGAVALVDRASCVARLGRGALVTPLLMAAVLRFEGDPAGIAEVLRLAEVLVFRLSVVGRRANAGESSVMTLARELRAPASTVADVQSKLRGLVGYYAPDAQVERALLEPDGSTPDGDFFGWAQLPFLLFEYERWLVEQKNAKFAYDWEKFFKKWRESIEHILPQGDHTLSVPYWGQRFDAEGLRRNRHRLGNLTLTEWNSSYGNRGFDQKCGPAGVAQGEKVYRNSQFRCERELADETTGWDEAAIGRRQKRLATFALQRWKA